MKILYFHQHFSTSQGATGTRSYEMARRLIDRGHEVTLVCGAGFMADTGLAGEPVNGMKRGVVDGIDVIAFDLGYSNYFGLAKRAWIFIEFALKSIAIAWREPFDLLYATSTPLTAGVPGIVMRVLKPGKKFVFEVRDLWPELPKAMGVISNPLVLAALWCLEQLSYLSMHAGVALSPGIRDGMRKRMGSGKDIAVIPNGCDLDLFKPPWEDAGGDKSLPDGIPNRGTRCIFTGAHGVANGLDAVLDAARVLEKKNRNDIALLFVGDGKCKPKLMKRAVSQRLDNCIFLDPIPKKSLANMLRFMDVGMMILDNVPAFYYGTSPNKFFDYISGGLPVLINYPGWLAELINVNACGIVVPPDDPEAFAEALIELADHPGKRQAMAVNSRRLAATQFSRRDLADRLAAFLEKTLSLKVL